MALLGWDEIIKISKGNNIKQNEIAFVNKSLLKKCLYKLQENLEVKSAQDIVDKLEILSWKANLKYMSTSNGNTTEIFVSSDMFYIEIQIEMPSGNINTVKVAHNNGEPTSYIVFSKLNFEDFLTHLNGINQLYQISADKKQKAKIYLALNSLENDLLELYKLQNTITDLYMLVTRAPLGFVTHRLGGLPMSFIFYLSPYDLINCHTKKINNITHKNLTLTNIGLKVSLNIRGAEDGNTHKLQTSPVLSLITSPEGKILPHFAALNNQNSSLLNAFFCLEFDDSQNFIISIPFLKKIQSITGINILIKYDGKLSIDNEYPPSLTNLLIKQYFNTLESSQLTPSSNKITKDIDGAFKFYMKLPQSNVGEPRSIAQKYIFTRDGPLGEDSGSLSATVVKRIPFTHPTHIPQILMVLRQQALTNSLLQTCFRLYGPKADQYFEGPENWELWSFDIFLDSPDYINVTHTNEKYQIVTRIEINLSDMAGIKIKIYSSNCESPQLTELATKMEAVCQKSVSLPLALATFSHHIGGIFRAQHQAQVVVKKLENFKNQASDVPSERTEKNVSVKGARQSFNPNPVENSAQESTKVVSQPNKALKNIKADKQSKPIPGESKIIVDEIMIKNEPFSETASERSWPCTADKSLFKAQLDSERPSSCPTAFGAKPSPNPHAKYLIENSAHSIKTEAHKDMAARDLGPLSVPSTKKNYNASSHVERGSKLDKSHAPSLPALNISKEAIGDGSLGRSKHSTSIPNALQRLENFPNRPVIGSELAKKHGVKLPGNAKKRKRSPSNTDGPFKAAIGPNVKTKVKHNIGPRPPKTAIASMSDAVAPPPLKKISIKELMNNNSLVNPASTHVGPKGIYGATKKPQALNFSSNPMLEFGFKGSLSSLPKIPKTSTAQSSSLIKNSRSQGPPPSSNSSQLPKLNESSQNGTQLGVAESHTMGLPCRTDIFPSPDLFRRLAKNMGIKGNGTNQCLPSSPPKITTSQSLPKIKLKLGGDPIKGTNSLGNGAGRNLVTSAVDGKDTFQVSPAPPVKQFASLSSVTKSSNETHDKATPKDLLAQATAAQSGNPSSMASLCNKNGQQLGKFTKKNSLSAVIDKLKSAGSIGTSDHGPKTSTTEFFGREDESLSLNPGDESTESSRSTMDHSFSDPTTPDKNIDSSSQPGPQPAIKMTITKRTNSDGSLEIVSSVVKHSTVCNVTTLRNKPLSLPSSPGPTHSTSSTSKSAFLEDSAPFQRKLIRELSNANSNSTSFNSGPGNFPFGQWGDPNPMNLGDIDDRRFQQGFTPSILPPPPLMGMLDLVNNNIIEHVINPNPYFYQHTSLEGPFPTPTFPNTGDQDERQLSKDHFDKGSTQGSLHEENFSVPLQGLGEDDQVTSSNEPNNTTNPSSVDATTNVAYKASPRVIDDDLMDEALMSSSLS